MSNFNEISKKYEHDSLVQRSASDILLNFLNIQEDDDVLDLGCGTGHISKLIKEKTHGNVVGVDPSLGMIENARERFSSQNITFRVCSAEQLDYKNDFNVIFCNSAFQWFTDPAKALSACYDSLKINGRMAIQAPAKDDYCPNFIQAIRDVKNHQLTCNTFAHFNPPWFFRNTADEYTELFIKSKFAVNNSEIVEVSSDHSVKEAIRIFESGAAAGYLNQRYYSTPISQDYIDAFRSVITSSFEHQADEMEQIKLTFYRIYLLATKK